jgi:hypothetical protein
LAAFPPHLVDRPAGNEILSGDTLNHKFAAPRLGAQGRRGELAAKEDPAGLGQAHRLIIAEVLEEGVICVGHGISLTIVVTGMKPLPSRMAPSEKYIAMQTMGIAARWGRRVMSSPAPCRAAASIVLPSSPSNARRVGRRGDGG